MKDKFVPRRLQGIIANDLFKGKAIIIHGPRQCGKTTMVKRLAAEMSLDPLWLNGDDDSDQALFQTVSASSWRQLLGHRKVVVIDEAQVIPRVGQAVKLLVDQFPHVQAILTGSSSFQLSNLTEEPLTGRKYEYRLFPLSCQELISNRGFHDEYSRLGDRLVYGSYPEIVVDPTESRRHLKLLAESYLFKDLLRYDGIRKPALLRNLVQALALQIGNEVSYPELSNLLGISRPTVDSYISLLEQAYIVFSLPSLSRNKRTEIRKGRKVYFWDVGIRNAVLDDFRPVDARPDIGHLWENYLVSERLKRNEYMDVPPSHFFWRTRDQFEVDYIEDDGGRLNAWEFKWRADSPRGITRAFTNAYPDAALATVTTTNYIDFVG
ncbi:MAG: ATP-binding protein [Proteobacteria bacterium]|nr:ATP-binding protein [Pseudomonadota bacterium]